MTHDLDLLRRHLHNIHQVDSAPALDDQTAIEEHWDAHNSHPAANRWYHNHADGIPPTICPDPRPNREQPPAGGNDPFLTPIEIAHDLRVSKMTVMRLLHRGTLPHIRVGRQFRIRRSDYLQYLEKKEN